MWYEHERRLYNLTNAICIMKCCDLELKIFYSINGETTCQFDTQKDRDETYELLKNCLVLAPKRI